MDTWIRYQVGLEFTNINVQGTIESKRGGKRRDNLSNESVQVGIGWSFNIKISSTDIIDGFIIEHDGNIGMFKKRVG